MITKDEISHLAHLAGLELTKQEIENFPSQIEQILEYIKIIDKAETKNVKPSFFVHNNINNLRQDINKECPLDIKESILKNAPKLENNYLKTKSVFKFEK